MSRFVAVAGNIGVGKSTLVELLAEKMGWTPFYEPQSQNPYLADFYRDMQEWSFQSQIFFLSRRLRAHRDISNHPGPAVQDRSVYEDAEIFAQNLFLERNMSDRDYQTYRRGRWKSMWARGRGFTVLHDLEADPGERRDLAKVEPEVVARHRARVSELTRALGTSNAATATLSADDEERLRALGYVD